MRRYNINLKIKSGEMTQNEITPFSGLIDFRRPSFKRPIEHIRYPGELNDPYVPPVRQEGPSLLDIGVPVHINTQGCDTYQKMGILYDPDNQEHRLPLYGRRKYNGRSDKYEYYTEDSSVHKNKIDIKNKNYDELDTNDKVTVPGYPNELTAEIYEVDTPRYCG